jgi:hypothetical protein
MYCKNCKHWGPRSTRDMGTLTWDRETTALGRCAIFEQGGRFSSMRRGDVEACEKFESEE